MIAIVLIVIVAFEGHRMAGALPRIEQLVGAQGSWRPVVYVLAVIVLAPLLFSCSFSALRARSCLGCHWARFTNPGQRTLPTS